MNEAELVKQCLKGKHNSQKQLYEHYAPKMFGVCYRYAQSREEAEDFLQEAFITIFRKLQQWKGEGELGAWIRRIVINTSLNGIKARHRFTDSVDAVSIENIAGNMALHQPANDSDLIELIRQLPKGCQTVFNLYAIEGYTHDEIGNMLNIKASTSRSQFMKARVMLMQKINPTTEIIKRDK